MSIERDNNKNEGYIAQSTDTQGNLTDIDRLRIQSREQNRRTSEFIDFPADTHFKTFVMPFCGGGESLEAYLPYLDKNSEVIFIDKSPDKVEEASKFAESLGFKGRVRGIAGPALTVFNKLKEEGVQIDGADIKLGLIWDEKWQDTLKALFETMSEGGKVVIQDIDPGTMAIVPPSEDLNILLDALLKLRAKFGYENNIISKLNEASENVGFVVTSKSEYQTITKNGHTNHGDVLRFFDGAGANMVKVGLISESDFIKHRNAYAESLKSGEMAYPNMLQLILEVPKI